MVGTEGCHHEQRDRTFNQLPRLRAARDTGLADCLVSFVLGEEPDELVMTAEEADVVQLFTSQGMMPRLKFQHRSAIAE